MEYKYNDKDMTRWY